jgi:hypothetical protein
MIKRGRAFSIILPVLAVLLGGGQTVPEDIRNHPACPICGMDREQFGHARVLVDYDDGTSVGTCSLRCAAVDQVGHMEKTPKRFRVGEFDTKNLLDAERAFWVVGGNVAGVMADRGKWAFATREKAEKFRTESGGSLSSFADAMKAAFEDIYAEIRVSYERLMKRKTTEKGGRL